MTERHLIERTLQSYVLDVASRYPVVTLTGPRQSGKTTLCRAAFPHLPYVSLETPTNRSFALEDPVAFLDRYSEGAVFDEVQRTPELLSYLQERVDEDPTPGRFVLTGSENLALRDALNQSLAGRTALAELLPLSLKEARLFPNFPVDLFTVLATGGYPRIYEQHLPPMEWLESYLATYVERDVRKLLAVGDLLRFQTFLKLCAGRCGQLLNFSSLAADAGISHSTASAWFSVLEASYIVFRLPPFHKNLGKRLVKTPKLYFYDVGLAAHLLGIENGRQIETHPLRGALFETWVVTEILKAYRHQGRRPRLSFYRDRSKLEVDLILENGAEWIAIEIKSGQTPSGSYFSSLGRFAELQESAGGPKSMARFVVYGGAERQKRSQGVLLPWTEVGQIEDSIFNLTKSS